MPPTRTTPPYLSFTKMGKKSKKVKKAKAAMQQARLPASLDAASAKEVANDLDSFEMLAMEESLMKMRKLQIPDSISRQGIYAHSLQAMDRKLCNFFLPNKETAFTLMMRKKMNVKVTSRTTPKAQHLRRPPMTN